MPQEWNPLSLRNGGGEKTNYGQDVRCTCYFSGYTDMILLHVTRRQWKTSVQTYKAALLLTVLKREMESVVKCIPQTISKKHSML